MQKSILAEFSGVDLGDERRNERARALVRVVSRDPCRSFPDALGEGAGLEGCYRLLNNDDVDSAALLAPHLAATRKRISNHTVALAVHDTTEFRFSGPREDLSPLQGGQVGHGFRSHYSLAVSADGRREPLGLLALTSWSNEPKGRPSTDERRKDDVRKSKRWLAQSEAVEGSVGDVVSLIHVEDREADIYDSLCARARDGVRFIVRAQTQRLVLGNEGFEAIGKHMRELPRCFRRQVTLSPRPGSPSKKKAAKEIVEKKATKRHSSNPPREGRVVTLAFAAAEVILRRPRADDGCDDASIPPSLTLRAVHVIEESPPEGEAAVEWLLFTTEPIDTDEEIAFVVDSYRARWVIEEYFKALKTGCAYEERQLESYGALQRALSIFSVTAWRLLWMRFLAHHSPDAPASDLASPTELAVLRARGDFAYRCRDASVVVLHLKRGFKRPWFKRASSPTSPIHVE